MPKIPRSQKWVGGVINKTSGKNNFQSILNMVKNPRCQITTISYTSLKGFVLKVHVSKKEGELQLPTDDIEFFGLNESKTAFDSPIDTVVIKFAVLQNQSEEEEELYPYTPVSGLEKDVHKETDIIDKFREEALNQSKIYKITASKGDPVCPAFIDFSHISDRLAIERWFDLIFTKCKDDESAHIIQYLKSIFVQSDQPGYMYMDDVELGMITMESAAEYQTVSVAMDGVMASDEQTARAIHEQIFTQVLRLYNETHIVHADFHRNNCLLKKREDGSYHPYIIDFGRIITVDNLIQTQLQIANEYAQSKFQRKDLFISNQRLHRLAIDPNLLVKHESFDQTLCKTLLFFLFSLEYMYNKYEFNEVDKSKLHRLYDNALGSKTSLDNIVTALNDYYNTKSVSIRRFDDYNVVNSYTDYDRTLEDIQGDDVIPRASQDVNGSPGRKIQKRKQPMSVLQRRNKSMSTLKGVDSSSNKKSRVPRMPLYGDDSESYFTIKPPRFVDSDSETSFPENHSYPNVATSFSALKGGTMRKRCKKSFRRCPKRNTRKRIR